MTGCVTHKDTIDFMESFEIQAHIVFFISECYV